jgi:hypothetical protein
MGGAIRRQGESKEQQRFAEFDQVTPGYFSLLDIPIVRGRNFTDAESADAQRQSGTRPVIISETAARTFFGDGDPLGRTLLRDNLTDETALEVVGVAADAQLTSLGTVVPYIYEPSPPSGVLLVKSRAGFAATASGIRALVQASDPNVAFRVLPLESNVAFWRGLSGMVTTLGAGLGLLALVLASVGIYGVVSFATARSVSGWHWGRRRSTRSAPSFARRCVRWSSVARSGSRPPARCRGCSPASCSV